MGSLTLTTVNAIHASSTLGTSAAPIQRLEGMGLSQGQAWGAMLLVLLFALLLGLLAVRRWKRTKRSSAAPTSYPYAGEQTIPIGELGREGIVNPQPSAPWAWSATLPPQQIKTPLPASMPLPENFNVEEFVSVAKLQFIKLQAAWDAGAREVLREYTTNELYGRILMGLGERAANLSQTEVITLDADVLGVHGGSGGFDEIAVVRFRGMLRETLDAPAQAFDEIWNLTRKEPGTWLLAGIERLTLGQTGSQYADPNATADPFAGPQTLQQIF
jgi:predicted lipid-binding transport protein (Tim44 family)